MHGWAARQASMPMVGSAHLNNGMRRGHVPSVERLRALCNEIRRTSPRDPLAATVRPRFVLSAGLPWQISPQPTWLNGRPVTPMPKSATLVANGRSVLSPPGRAGVSV